VHHACMAPTTIAQAAAAPLEELPDLLELGGVAVQRAVLLPGQPRRPRRQRPPRQGARLEQVAGQRAGQPPAQSLRGFDLGLSVWGNTTGSAGRLEQVGGQRGGQPPAQPLRSD
jgi:hypothetical protein